YATIIGARRLPSRILLAVALSLSLHLLDCAVTASPAGQLQACFNRNASTQAPYFVEDYVTERPSSMLIVVVVVALTLPHAQSMLQSPGGPICRLTIHSVLWSTKLKPAQQATGNSSDLPCWGIQGGGAVEANPTSCAMRLLLVTELLGEQSALLLFPINSLRNVALLAADTPLVAMIDVDMMLSSTLSDEFGGLAGRRGPGSSGMLTDWKCPGSCMCSAAEVMRLCRAGSLLVLPAFEFCEQGEHDLPTRTAMAERIARGDAAGWLSVWVLPMPMCSQIQHTSLYEPWYIVDRIRNPWYDARFRGYGMDKQQQVTVAALDRKLTFMVHPMAFIVHMPHKKSHAYHKFMAAAGGSTTPSEPYVRQVVASMHTRALAATYKPSASNLSNAEVGMIMRKQNEDTFYAFAKHLQEGGSDPSQSDPQVQACLTELPWWQAVGGSAT
ncbi:hypothetical protein QJQ45_023625, partial [Haematococcus lacustris]